MISNKMALNCTSLHQSRLLVSEVLLFSSGYRFKRVNDADLHLKGAVIYTLETPRASSSSSSPLRTQTQHPRVPLARPTPTGPPVLGDPPPRPLPRIYHRPALLGSRGAKGQGGAGAGTRGRAGEGSPAPSPGAGAAVGPRRHRLSLALPRGGAAVQGARRDASGHVALYLPRLQNIKERANR